MDQPAPPRRILRWLISLVVAAAALRLVTLGNQSFWVDEAITAAEVKGSFGRLLRMVPHSESSPPLYPVLVWCWSKMFGTSEIALRSLSALFGILLVPVAYAVTWTFLRRRYAAVGVAAAATFSPILVWYSQEARGYALYVLLSALSMLFFARSMDEASARNLWSWSAWSTLAIGTHYFALAPVVAEAALLLRVGRRRVIAPLCAPIAIAAALAPLALYQNEHVAPGAWIGVSPLVHRIDEVPSRFTAFAYNPGIGQTVVAVALATLAYRGRRVGHAGAALWIAGAALGLPLALAATGLVDVFYYRNVLSAWLPVSVAVAAGVPRARASAALAATACGALLVCTVVVATKPRLQRDSWRTVARELRQSNDTRLVVTNFNDAYWTLGYYWPRLRQLADPGARVKEIDLVGRFLTPSSTVPTLPEFRPVRFQSVGNLSIVRLRAREPVLVRPAALSAHGLTAKTP